MMFEKRAGCKVAVCNLFKLWSNTDTYIFKNCFDAMFGFLVLIILPAISLSYVITSGSTMFSSYGFPILSISFAAIYDCYGRYFDVRGTSQEDNVKKMKNGIRVFLHICTVLATLFFCGNQSYGSLKWTPYTFLFLSACVVIGECVVRIRYSFLISFGGWILCL